MHGLHFPFCVGYEIRRVAKGAERGGVPVECIWRHAVVDTHTAREKIAAHYLNALNSLFSSDTTHEYVIIIEDDLIVSQDFYAYIHAFLPFLYKGEEDELSSTLCVSGWNDNGASSLFYNERVGRRTSFFPGLGWALSRGAWKSVLRKSWPGQDGNAIVGIGWDFWLRTEFTRRGWNCVTPDVPRVYHVGKYGTNVGAVEAVARFDRSKLSAAAIGNVDWNSVAAELFANFESGAARHEALVKSLRGMLAGGRVMSSLEELGKGSMGGSLVAGKTVSLDGADLAPASSFRNATNAQDDESDNIVIVYRRATYEETIARPLNLWPSPRGHFEHVLRVQLKSGSFLNFVDGDRAAHMLSGDLRSAILGSAHVLSAAKLGESCQTHCDSTECSSISLEGANSCAALQSHFPCTQCAYETGADLPAYVVPKAGGNLSTEGLCLISESGTGQGGALECTGSFPYTRRLCVCLTSKEAQNPSWAQDEL